LHSDVVTTQRVICFTTKTFSKKKLLIQYVVTCYSREVPGSVMNNFVMFFYLFIYFPPCYSNFTLSVITSDDVTVTSQLTVSPP